MSKIGFHIMTSNGVNSPWLGKFQSKVHLLLATSIAGNIPQLVNLCQTYPNTHFVYRAWDYGGLGNSDHFSDYFKRYGANPEPLIKAHEPVLTAASHFRDRFSIQLWNECGHEREAWPNFIAFNVNFVTAMDALGFSASTLGLGPGHPAWEGSGDARSRIKEAWVQAKPLFEAIINAKQQHIINLHEYHAYPWTRFEPWVIGRFRWMLDDIREMGLSTDKIKIVIGESGLTDPGALNYPSPSGPNGYLWSLAQGHTPEQLAEDYMEMVRKVYDPSPNVLGLCYFSFGGEWPYWYEFDLLREPRILYRMEQLLDMEEYTVIETPVTKFEVVSDTLRVRSDPSLSGTVIRTLTKGDMIESDGYINAENYHWRRLVNGGGFSAKYSLTTSDIFMIEETVTPVPDWKTELLAQIALIRQEIDELQSLIIQAP